MTSSLKNINEFIERLRKNQNETTTKQPNWISFWEGVMETQKCFQTKIKDHIMAHDLIPSDSLIYIQNFELRQDLFYIHFCINSGLYNYALQRLRYILEGWSFAYHCDIMNPELKLNEKWTIVEALNEKHKTGFIHNVFITRKTDSVHSELKTMVKNLVPTKRMLHLNPEINEFNLHKFAHPSYGSTRQLILDEKLLTAPITHQEFELAIHKAHVLYNSKSHETTVILFIELLIVLGKFVEAFILSYNV